MEPVLYPAKNKLCFISDFSMPFCITTSACGSQVGHVMITSGMLCGSVGQHV